MGCISYRTDENGNSVTIIARRSTRKVFGRMLWFLLEWRFPDRSGKNPKIEVPHHGGVLIVGDVPNDIPHKANKGPAASVRARQWKAAWRMIRDIEVLRSSGISNGTIETTTSAIAEALGYNSPHRRQWIKSGPNAASTRRCDLMAGHLQARQSRPKIRVLV